MKLSEFIEKYGYTKAQWMECVNELCSHGIARGVFKDFNLLALVSKWLTENC